MALVVGTNSYTDATFADTYLAEIGEDAVWTLKTADEKAIALIQATRYMEGKYFGAFSGSITSLTQVLAFPRDFITDKEGRTYNNNITPDAIKKGCCLFAVKTFTATLLSEEASTGALIEEEVAGVIKQKWAESFDKQKQYTEIENVFKHLLVNYRSDVIPLVK